MNELEDEISLHRLSIATLREYIDTAEWLGGKARVADILDYSDKLRRHMAKLAELTARLETRSGASISKQ